jgi:hypothetical protein
MALDQLVFEDEGFQLSIGDDPFEVGHVLDQAAQTGGWSAEAWK